MVFVNIVLPKLVAFRTVDWGKVESELMYLKSVQTFSEVF